MITELAKESNAAITLDEFRTLNRLLDNAIAGAVSSYGRHHHEFLSARPGKRLHERMGNIGVMRAPGQVLEDSLTKLRGLVDPSPPEVDPSSAMTARVRT